MDDKHKLYRQVIECMTSGVAAFQAVRDPRSGEIVDFEWTLSNAYAESVIGRPESELIGKRLLEELPEHGPSGVFDRYRRVVEGGGDDKFIVEYADAGVAGVFDVRATKMGDGVVVAFTDVTEETRRRRDYEKAVERLSVATSAARIGVWEGDPVSGDITLPDAITSGLYGFKPGAMIPFEDWRETIHPDDFPEVAARIAEHRAHIEQDDVVPLTVRFRVRAPDGGARHIQSYSQTVITEEGLRVFGVNWDITEEVEQRRAIETLASRLSIATRSAGIGVWEHDLETGEPMWDETTYQILGLDPSVKATPEVWRELIHPDDLRGVERAVEAAFASDGSSPDASFGVRFRVIRPDGAVRHVQSHAHLVISDHGRRLVGVNWDVTEEIEAARELDLKRREAEAANIAKSQFLAVMSHEIRTPLNGVLGIAALLVHTELTGEQRKLLKIIERSGDELLEILNDILELSRIEAGRLEIEKARFDLDELLRRAGELFEPQAREKGVAFRIESGARAHGDLVGDPTRVRQVLYNLLSNAVKFTLKGEIVVSADVIAPAAEDGARRELVFTVRDTGVGVPEEKLKLIFEPFTQADGSTTRRFGGAGLGLSVASQLAHVLGGAITVSSKQGEGSTFTARLAVEAADLNAEENPAAEPSEAPAPPASLRVLAAEDSATNQLVLAGLLRACGAATKMVENGLEAIEAWAAAPFDLILLDIQMPVMDGVAAAREIRRLEAETGRSRAPIIAVSANAMDHQIESYLAAGMDAHIAKPVKPRDLVETMARVMAPAARDPQPPGSRDERLAAHAHGGRS